MGTDDKAAIAVISAEVIKALLMLAFEEARRRGLDAAALEKIYLTERLAFLDNTPDKIPEV